MFEQLFSPGRKHTQDEANRLELTRVDVADGDPGRGPIDLESGKVVVRLREPGAEGEPAGEAEGEPSGGSDAEPDAGAEGEPAGVPEGEPAGGSEAETAEPESDGGADPEVAAGSESASERESEHPAEPEAVAEHKHEPES
ncbi:DUF6191 domain-containing protein [Streptomyces sp. NPDC086082]|uniref:DUF6191 domain-containing protein n=1 Tax=Streptomyces sp. NPDC086082 TaxID=3365750 RepID=UPI003825D948